MRMINRWRLEKADPSAKLSPPKKQIIWYIEDTVPEEYRPYVQEGILEWNKAFEKIGFKDAIAVRWQARARRLRPRGHQLLHVPLDHDELTFAMSGLRTNPLTGEMIDGDVIFDASWIKVWKEEYAFLMGVPIPTGTARGPIRSWDRSRWQWARSSARSWRRSKDTGSPLPPPGTRRAAALKRQCCGNSGRRAAAAPHRWPSTWSPPAGTRSRLSSASGSATAGRHCNYAAAKAHEMRFAALALAMRGQTGSDKAKARHGW